MADHDHAVDAFRYMAMTMNNVQTWWKYDSLWNRIIRRKTIYYFVPKENWTIGYQLRKSGDIYVVYSGKGRKQ